MDKCIGSDISFAKFAASVFEGNLLHVLCWKTRISKAFIGKNIQ